MPLGNAIGDGRSGGIILDWTTRITCKALHDFGQRLHALVRELWQGCGNAGDGFGSSHGTHYTTFEGHVISSGVARLGGGKAASSAFRSSASSFTCSAFRLART